MGTAQPSAQSSSHMFLDSRLVYRSHFIQSDTDVEIGENGDQRNPVSFSPNNVIYIIIFMDLFNFALGMQSDRPDLLPSMPPLAGSSGDFEATDISNPSVPPVR